VVACAALLLGGKTEESPKSLHNLLRVMCEIRYAAQPREEERALVRTCPKAPVLAPAFTLVVACPPVCMRSADHSKCCACRVLTSCAMTRMQHSAENDHLKTLPAAVLGAC
jgi:hypothetical protein